MEELIQVAKEERVNYNIFKSQCEEWKAATMYKALNHLLRGLLNRHLLEAQVEFRQHLHVLDEVRAGVVKQLIQLHHVVDHHQDVHQFQAPWGKSPMEQAPGGNVATMCASGLPARSGIAFDVNWRHQHRRCLLDCSSQL